MNREAWLTEVAHQCLPIFKGFTIGKFRVTCGWPCTMALSKNRRIGECHGPKSSSDGHSELFISPLLDKPVEVAGVLCHEIAHIAAGVEAAHGKQFLKVCTHVGLTHGKPTSISPGKRLTDRLHEITSKVGKYPHSAMKPMTKKAVKGSSVSVLECDCGCRITMSNKMLDEYGPPTCTCGKEFDKV